MTYFLCPISQCVVMTLNPGVEMGIINKLYYNYYLRASISIISVPAAFAASIAGSILLSFTESRSVIIWTCRTKIQLVPCDSNYLHFYKVSLPALGLLSVAKCGGEEATVTRGTSL